MREFIERLKTDRMLQIIIGVTILSLAIFFYLFRGILFPKKGPQLPCYKANLKIWAPFEEKLFSNFLSELSYYCIQVKIENKSLDEIDRELPISLLGTNRPDIVFLDDNLLKKYNQILATPTPIFVDTLIAYYNQDVLNFLNLEKPKTFDELKIFIQKLKNYPNFYPVGLGTKEIRNRKEIILSLYSLSENYKDKNMFSRNIKDALLKYLQFSDPQSEFYSYPSGSGDDLENFAKEKLALYLGFYKDKKEILKINPRMNFSIGYYPLNTFPPKSKIYTKLYYFAPLKTYNLEASQFFISWFYSFKILDFSNYFDLVPFLDSKDLPEEKRIIVDSAINFGEIFDFLNQNILLDNLDRLLESIKDETEFNRVIYEIQPLL